MNSSHTVFYRKILMFVRTNSFQIFVNAEYTIIVLRQRKKTFSMRKYLLNYARCNFQQLKVIFQNKKILKFIFNDLRILK